jgi:hypothetical protein
MCQDGRVRVLATPHHDRETEHRRFTRARCRKGGPDAGKNAAPRWQRCMRGDCISASIPSSLPPTTLCAWARWLSRRAGSHCGPRSQPCSFPFARLICASDGPCVGASARLIPCRAAATSPTVRWVEGLARSTAVAHAMLLRIGIAGRAEWRVQGAVRRCRRVSPFAPAAGAGSPWHVRPVARPASMTLPSVPGAARRAPHQGRRHRPRPQRRRRQLWPAAHPARG